MLATKRFYPTFLLLILFLSACSPYGTLPVSPTSTPEIRALPTIAPTATASPTPTILLPTTTPVSTPILWESTRPELVAVELCQMITPDGQGRPYEECGIEVYHPLDLSPVFSIAQAGMSYKYPTFSPNGRWMAYEEMTTTQTHLRIIRTDWQEDRPVTEWFPAALINIKYFHHLSWSPDSQWLAFDYSDWGYSFKELYITNIEVGEAHRVTEAFVMAFAWSAEVPPRLAFAVAGGEEGLYWLPVDDGEKLEPIPVSGFSNEGFPDQLIYTLAWEPGKSRLVLCKQGLRLVDLSTQVQELVTRDVSNCEDLSWSPDGHWVSVRVSGFRQLYDVEQGEFGRPFAMDCAGWAGEDVCFRVQQPFSGVLSGFTLWGVAVRSKEQQVLWTTDHVHLGEGVGPEHIDVTNISWYWNPSPGE